MVKDVKSYKNETCLCYILFLFEAYLCPKNHSSLLPFQKYPLLANTKRKIFDYLLYAQ